MDYLFSADFIAGCVAGSIGIVATQPMDTIRIRMQLYQETTKKTFRQHFISIVKTEGIHGLFRGVASPTLTVGLMSAILFQSFESSKVLLNKFKSYKSDNNQLIEYKSTYFDMIIAGAMAGIVSCVITTPTELIKIEVQKSSEPGTATIRQEMKVGTNLWRKYGIIHGLYRGFNVTILRDSMAFMIYFPLYEYIVSEYDINRETEIVPFIGGGLAGLVSWALCYPFDYIKTHYQTRNYLYGKTNLFNAIYYHYKQEIYIKNMFKGCGATLIRATPQHAIVFLCYEKVKQMINYYELSKYEKESGILVE